MERAECEEANCWSEGQGKEVRDNAGEKVRAGPQRATAREIQGHFMNTEQSHLGSCVHLGGARVSQNILAGERTPNPQKFGQMSPNSGSGAVME